MSYINELTTLINDSLSGRVGLFANGAEKYTDQAIREAFFEILGDDKLTYQNFRNHKNEIFSIMENVLTTNLPLAWENSDFYRNFVDTKSTTFGDTNEFVVDDNSTMLVSRISGNHWQIERQKLQGKKAFSVSLEWVGIRVYAELESFLKGTITLADMMAKLQKAFQNEIDARIVASFNGIGTYLPAKFQESGTYDRATMNDLIQRVQIASQKDVILAGTRSALAAVAEGTNSAWISNSAKEELATTGVVVENIGLPCRAMIIPQTFVRGTYDFSVNNNVLYVLPEGTKPVKLFFEGQTRARDLDSQQTQDMTIDAVVESKIGTAIIVDSLVGKYTIV